GVQTCALPIFLGAKLSVGTWRDHDDFVAFALDDELIAPRVDCALAAIDESFVDERAHIRARARVVESVHLYGAPHNLDALFGIANAPALELRHKGHTDAGGEHADKDKHDHDLHERHTRAAAL